MNTLYISIVHFSGIVLIQDDLFEFPVFERQPKSMEEFFSRLETIGKAWHKAYDTIDSDTDRVIKITKMDARTTLDLLEHLSPVQLS